MEPPRRIAAWPLWIGHAGNARDPHCVRAHSIVAIIDLAIDEAPLVPAREIVYARFPLVDGPGNPAWVVRAAINTVAALLQQGTATLVCCSAGMSRSPAVSAAALSIVTRHSPGACLDQIARAGPTDVSPALWVDVLAACAPSS